MSANGTIGIIMLHPGCNMVCDFCVTEDTFSAMSFAQAVKLLNYIKKIEIGNVVFGGGEPFAWEQDLVKLTEQAKAMGFLVQIGTNGVAMPENFERIQTIDRYCVPLESANPNTHNAIRLYKNEHHALILDRLQRLQESGKSVTVSTVVSRDSISGLKELGLLLKGYNDKGTNLHAWHLYKFLPEGRGGRPSEERLSITEQDFDDAVREVKQMDLGFTIYKRKNMFQSKTVSFFWYRDDQICSVGALPPAPPS